MEKTIIEIEWATMFEKGKIIMPFSDYGEQAKAFSRFKSLINRETDFVIATAIDTPIDEHRKTVIWHFNH